MAQVTPVAEEDWEEKQLEIQKALLNKSVNSVKKRNFIVKSLCSIRMLIFILTIGLTLGIATVVIISGASNITSLVDLTRKVQNSSLYLVKSFISERLVVPQISAQQILATYESDLVPNDGASYTIARDYVYDSFTKLQTIDPTGFHTMMVYNRRGDTNITLIGFEGIAGMQHTAFVSWPGITDIDKTHIYTFTGNASSVDLNSSHKTEINQVNAFASQLTKLSSWSKPLRSDCVTTASGKRCDVYLINNSLKRNGLGQWEVLSQVFVRTSDFSSKIANAISRIPNSVSYVIDTSTGYIIASSTSDLLQDEAKKEIYKATHIPNDVISTSANKIQEVYGKTFDDIGLKVNNKTERFNLKYSFKGGVAYCGGSFHQTASGLNLLAVLVVQEKSFIGRYVAFVSVAVALSIIIAVIGLIIGAIVAILIYSPLTKLVKQMSYLESMRLDEVDDYSTSAFTEIATIQSTFFVVVERLREYKTYLPSYVLKRDYGIEDEEKKEEPAVLEKQLSQVTPSASDSMRMNKRPSLSQSSSHNRRESTVSDTSSAMIEKKFALGVDLNRSCVLVAKIDTSKCQLSPQELVKVHSALLEAIDLASTKTRGLMVSFDQKTFSLFWNEFNRSSSACQCAMLFAESFQRVRDQGVNRKNMKLSIGIAVGFCYSGTVGTKMKRQFVTFGECHDFAKQLCDMNSHWDTQVLITDTVLTASITKHYVTRPIASLGINEAVSTVHELISKKDVKSDEWMYEMAQEESFSKYGAYCKGFESLKAKNYGEATELFIQQLETTPDDIASQRLLQLSEKLQKSSDDKELVMSFITNCNAV